MPHPKPRRPIKIIWLVVHDCSDGELPSIDSGNPWRTKKAALKAIKRMGPIKAPIYRVQAFVRRGIV